MQSLVFLHTITGVVNAPAVCVHYFRAKIELIGNELLRDFIADSHLRTNKSTANGAQHEVKGLWRLTAELCRTLLYNSNIHSCAPIRLLCTTTRGRSSFQ